MEKIEIRKYRAEDLEALSRLFYETVHAVNARDYTEEQLAAWAGDAHTLARRRDLAAQTTLVATLGGEIVGFGSIDAQGELDLLFVRRDCVGQGVGTLLCDRLEEGRSEIAVYASVTARPFFEARGYALEREHTAVRQGVALKNFFMRKRIEKTERGIASLGS